MKKTTYVLIGNFGSGKSELAINMALDSRKQGKKTAMVDLDIINPYFRSSDCEALLNDDGISVYKPVYAGTGVEGLSLPPDINAVFINDCETVIFDVGGDVTGSVALGQYVKSFEALDNLEVLFVINPRRPLSSDADSTEKLISEIMAVSRLKLTGLINNGNLSNETTAEDLLLGFEVVRELSKRLKIPVKLTMGTESVITDFKRIVDERKLPAEYIGEYKTINRLMKRDWDRFTGDVK